jgi:hypothetical protein
MSQSDELTAFYQAYVDWLDVGAPETVLHPKNPFEFLRGVGLCGNLRLFCFQHSCYGHHTMYAGEMIRQFVEAGLDKQYPFNRYSKDENSMSIEMRQDTCHINPKRLQWAKNHC